MGTVEKLLFFSVSGGSIELFGAWNERHKIAENTHVALATFAS
jgi:hypothetical protein